MAFSSSTPPLPGQLFWRWPQLRCSARLDDHFSFGGIVHFEDLPGKEIFRGRYKVGQLWHPSAYGVASLGWLRIYASVLGPVGIFHALAHPHSMTGASEL